MRDEIVYCLVQALAFAALFGIARLCAEVAP